MEVLPRGLSVGFRPQALTRLTGPKTPFTLVKALN